MITRKIFGRTCGLSAALVAGLALNAGAQVATVDGVGSVATADPTFTTSFATVEAALTAVKASALNIAGQSCEISITANNATAEGTAASLDLDTLCNLTIDGDVTGSTYGGELAVLRLTGSDATGSPAGTEGMAIQTRDSHTTTLRDLVLIPTNSAAAGAYNHRMLQIFNTTVTDTATLNFDRVIVSARKVSDNTPVLNPFVHAASANTRAARIAEYSAFDGGGGNNAIVIQNATGVTPTGGLLTINMTDTFVTHLGLMAAAASKGGGIAFNRTNFWTLNINAGCVFSYLDGSGIRSVGTMSSASTAVNVTGTLADPVFFHNNGWMEDNSTGRNEHLLMDGVTVTVSRAYFIGSFHEAVDILGLGIDSFTNCYFAESNKDLASDIATVPTQTANVKLSGSVNVSLTNCTVYNNLSATTPNRALNWTAPASATLTATNVVFAGASDQVNFTAATAATFNEDDCGFATSGADAMNATFLTTGITGITYNTSDRVEADPQFLSTTFSPTYSVASPFAAPTGLTNYLAIDSNAYRSGSTRVSPVASVDVVGANASSPLPVELSTFMVE